MCSLVMMVSMLLWFGMNISVKCREWWMKVISPPPPSVVLSLRMVE